MKFIAPILTALFLVSLVACDFPWSKEDPVVVSVGSKKLNMSQISRQAPEWDNWDDATRLSYLEHWIDEETIYQEAVDAGFDKNEELVAQMEETIRKMIVDRFLQSYADTMMLGDGEKLDYYHAHTDRYVRGKTTISGALIHFKDWQAADLYYKGHKAQKYDSLPSMHYLIKSIVPFDSVSETPDSCTIPDIRTAAIGQITPMKYCGGSLKIAVVLSRLDSADILPYEEVAEDVANLAWVEHKRRVMDDLKKQWKNKRPIFSQMDVFTEKVER